MGKASRSRKRAPRQAPPPPRGHNRLSVVILGLIAASLVIGAFGFYFNGQPDDFTQQVFGTSLELPTSEPAKTISSDDANLLRQPTTPAKKITPLPTGTGKLDETLNVLLLGSDRRPDDPVWRTDVMMVVFLDTANGRAAILSIPRDLYIDIPTRGWDRINISDFWGEYTKYQGGGPGLLSRVIADNFGIRIDKYARVDFQGFQQIVDTVGGIDVNVPCDIADDFIDPASPTGFTHLQVDAGLQHMNGTTALMFVRQRHGNGDISRNQRQQRVLFALRSKLLSPNIVPKIPQLYGQFQNTVQTDLGPLDLPGLVQMGLKVKAENIRGMVLDENLASAWMTPDGKSVLVFNKDKVRAAVENLFNAPPVEDSKVTCY